MKQPTARRCTLACSGPAAKRPLLSAWWLTAFPGAALALTVVGLNLWGDGLGDRLHPRRA